MKYSIPLFSLIFSSLFPILGLADYSDELKIWRQEREAELRSDSGWLTVAGLHPLKEGDYSIGSDSSNGIVLPAGAPAHLGRVNFIDQSATIQFTTTETVFLGENPVHPGPVYKLVDDSLGKPTEIKTGNVQFFLIQRSNQFSIRVRDLNSSNRTNFQGCRWFPENPEFLIQADWTESPRKVMGLNVQGQPQENTYPGFASFTVAGKQFHLYPTVQGEKLFFVFKDKTSRSQTYGASRFLYASMPIDGKVTLDFNRAINPPCAFTEFAVCPLPIKENRLDLEVLAGELKPAEAH